jgi:5-methyltetrahydrofolate--homocysteine methyltransferase
MTMVQQFTLRYRSKLCSFVYPAYPSLEDQTGIWTLLKPEEIGVQLTAGFMMAPEAGIRVLMFHHPNCRCFSVSDSGEN